MNFIFSYGRFILFYFILNFRGHYKSVNMQFGEGSGWFKYFRYSKKLVFCTVKKNGAFQFLP